LSDLSVVRSKILKIRSVIIIQFAAWVFFLISVFIKCMYFQITTEINSSPLKYIQNKYMFFSTLSCILLLSALIIILFNRKRIIALFILDIILTLLLVADTFYFRYYHNAITVPVLFQIGLLGPLGGSIKGLVKSADIIYLIDLPISIGFLVFLKLKGIEKIRLYKRAIYSSLIAVLGIILFIIPFTNVNTLWFEYDKNQIIKDMGIFYFHFNDVTTYIKENTFADKTLSENEKILVEDFFKNKTLTGKQYSGLAKGKNLIIIQMEAMQEFVINRKIGGKEITPNLNKLIKESVYFNNFHYQVGGGNTSDAEFLCNTSQYPAKEGAVYFRYPVNTYNTLPKALKEEGYNTYVFHAYHPSFWNRTVMYKAIGFDTFTSDKDFEPGEVIGFGLNDTSFFQQSLKKIDRSKPFYGFFVTLSSHYAFAPFKNYSFDVGEYENTDIGNYIKAANYVDKSIGVMIEELKKNNLYDNTILAIYGDHHSFPKGNADEFIKFLGMDNSDYEWTKNAKVPFILHYPGLKNGEAMNITSGELDIFPTVANLLGLHPKYAFGKDLLNTQNGYAVLRNGSVVTDRYIFINENSTVYDKSTGQILDEKTYDKEIKDLQKALDISDIALEKDAFKSVK
jgi:lipoteichoic acid synthase